MRYYNSRNERIREKKASPKRIMGVMLTAVTIGVSVYGVIDSKQPVTTIIETVDNKKDEYEKKIPIYSDEQTGEVIATLEENMLGVVEGKIAPSHRYKVTIIDADADIQEGYIEGKNLKIAHILKGKDAEKYTKIYEVTPEKGVNIRKSTKISDDNKIMAISKNEYVLGSETYEASKDNTFSWVPAIYLDEDNIIEGYIAKDFLKEINLEEQRAIVNTGVNSDVPLNVREEPSKQAEIIDQLENGTEVYIISSSKEIQKDGSIWKEIQILNEEDEVIKTGWVASEYLQNIEMEQEKDEEITEEEKSKTFEVDTSKVKGIDLNVREGTGVHTKKIGSISNGTKVTLLEDEPQISEASWVHISYLDEKTDEQKQGWVSTAYLKEIEENIKKKVDTSLEGSVDLKLRKTPSVQGKIEVEIPNGTIISVKKEDLENTVKEDNYEWVKIELEDGTKGYVANKFLTEYKENKKDDEKKEKQEITISNDSEQIMGIDVSEISTQTLDQLLKGKIKITNNINTLHQGTLDLSQYKDKDINYVYIKIGATGYGNTFSFVDFQNYKELSKVCEKNKIPYGFYYYSTCVNNEEAKKEAKRIEMLMDSLDEKEYNILPFAIDVELHEPDDRQSGIDVTEAKAYLANLVESTQGKTILYTSRNIVEDKETKILDLSQYNALIESGESDVWFVAPEGNQTHKESLENILQTEDTEVKMKQIVQDGILPTDEQYDINVMDKEMFIKYTKAKEIEPVQTKNNKEQEETR